MDTMFCSIQTFVCLLMVCIASTGKRSLMRPLGWYLNILSEIQGYGCYVSLGLVPKGLGIISQVG